jgi:hypothetical protein
MSDSESELSEWDGPEETPEIKSVVIDVKKQEEPTLYDVHSMIRNYEKLERKQRVDTRAKKKEVVLTPEQLADIQLTKKQLKEIERKAKGVRPPKTEKQMEAFYEKARAKLLKREEDEKTLDLRPDKSAPAVKVKYPEKKTRPPRPATAKPKPVEVDEDGTGSFQAKKPILPESDDEEEKEIQKKTEKLKKLDSVLSSNPFYAQVLASRGIRF